MPSYHKPKAWNLKPQMTAAPELWRNCVILFAFWPDTRIDAGARNLVDGAIFSPTTNGGGAIDGFDLTRFGSGYHIDNGSNASFGKYYNLATYLSQFGNVGTLWAYTSPDFLSSTRANRGDGVVWSLESGSSSDSPFSPYWPYYNDNDQIQVWNGDTTGSTGLSYSVGEWHNQFVEFDGADGTLFINGALNGSAPMSNPFASSMVLFNSTGIDRSFAGRCLIAGAWTDVNATRRRVLEQDPFAMLRPAAGF